MTGQLRPALLVGRNAAGVDCLEARPLAKRSGCNVVKFWGSVDCIGRESAALGEIAGEETCGVWSVSTEGVVESWDSRAGAAPQLRHILHLKNLDGALEVEGLDVIASQLLVKLGSGRAVNLDGRKLMGPTAC